MISLCSGAEYLMQTVYGAVPRECLEQGSSISAAQVAVHILDYLYKKMDKVCLVEGGEVVKFFSIALSRILKRLLGNLFK
ncbi:hypothetical protein LINPERPRIM_LOCUS4381 [Linum perenne]